MDAQDEVQAGQNKRRVRGERVVFYHPTSDVSGAAARVEPRMCRDGSIRFECFFLEMARQKEGPSRGEQGAAPAAPASFDWESKLTMKLGFSDICEIVAVLEARVDHAGGKRDGLFHRNGQTDTVIRFRRQEGGYLLAVSRKTQGEEELAKVSIVLSEVEAVGLRHVLGMGLFFMTLPAPFIAQPVKTVDGV